MDSVPSHVVMADTISMDSAVADSVQSEPIDTLALLQLRADSIRVADSLALVKLEHDSLQMIAASCSHIYELWRKNVPNVVSDADSVKWAKVVSFHTAAQRSCDSIMAVVRCDEVMDDALSYALTDYRMPVIAPRYVSSYKLQLPRGNESELNYGHGIEMPSPSRYFDRQMEAQALRTHTLFRYFSDNPFAVNWSLDRMAKAPKRSMMTMQEVSGTSVKVPVYTLSYAKPETEKIHADKWHYKGSHTLQMTQTSLSDNWYKGGENNMSLFSNQKFVIKRYDEKKITTFDMSMELRLSVYYASTDTVHSTRVNDNQFRLDVNYGYKAWKRWYYSSALIFKTPVFNYYAANSKTVRSSFLSPAEANLSLGLDYKFESKNKKVTYALLLAPLSYNVKYVNDDKVDPMQYGIKEGDDILHQFGSTLTSRFAWTITKDISLTSRVYVFTSYKGVTAEFENTCNFKVNRYFSAMLMYYPRFDDNTNKKPWQYKEMFTFGFNYVW